MKKEEKIMQTALKLTARVQPGKRIEFTAPELPDSGEVELFVVLPEKGGSTGESKAQKQGVWDYIQSLEPVKRTPEEWAAVEREFQEERDSWER
jgi:hypothetical protein